MQSYITKPKSVKRKEIMGREWIFSPARYKTYHINSNFETLDNLIEISKQSIGIGKQKKYFNYIEIGSINTSTGYIEPTYKRSIDISTDSVFKLQKDDILISTVRTYLGGIGIVNQDEENFIASKALIVLRDLKQNINRHYLFGVLRSSYFIEQTNLILNASMYPRMDKDSFHELKIPLPTPTSNPNPQAVQDLVSVLVQNIIDKEEQIKVKNAEIDRLIEAELYGNQKKSNFVYSMPRISEIRQQGRLDTGLYTEEFKKIDNVIKSYRGGCVNFENARFTRRKGPNLAISVIGESYYSDKKLSDSFKLLILSKNVSDSGGLVSKQYIGSKEKLPELKQFDFLLFARGDIGRVILIDDELIGATSNFDVFFISSKKEYWENVFVLCWLKYLKTIKFWNFYGVGGSGAASLTDYYFQKINIPIFPSHLQQQIAKLYYNKVDKNGNLTLENYLQKEKTRNSKAGIFQLNMEIFALREKLEHLVHKIVMEEKIEVEFE
jgi:restriction endonuclease S subunit